MPQIDAVRFTWEVFTAPARQSRHETAAPPSSGPSPASRFGKSDSHPASTTSLPATSVRMTYVRGPEGIIVSLFDG